MQKGSKKGGEGCSFTEGRGVLNAGLSSWVRRKRSGSCSRAEPAGFAPVLVCLPASACLLRGSFSAHRSRCQPQLPAVRGCWETQGSHRCFSCTPGLALGRFLHVLKHTLLLGAVWVAGSGDDNHRAALFHGITPGRTVLKLSSM